MDGMLLIDKPSGWTSFDVVAKVRSELRKSLKSKAESEKDKNTGLSTLSFIASTPSRKVKVGHTGTLDPLATGLLIIVVGTYCKRAGEFSGMDKVYEVTMTLGQTSTTGDNEGEKTLVNDTQPSEEAMRKSLEKFTGSIMQTPPIYSAIKIGGQRAYKLAREGKEVKLEPRPATIYRITDMSYTYPIVTFTTKVSSGTYIRSLVQDIGEDLGTGAYMSALQRTEVGGYKITNAQDISELELEKLLQG